MFFIDKDYIIQLHQKIIQQSGGSPGIRDNGALDSCIAQPFQTFFGEDLYSSMIDKAIALGYFLVLNHPFVDGNKRIGHAAMELVLFMNGWEIVCNVDEQEKIILSLAAGKLDKETFFAWVRDHLGDLSF